MKYAIIESGGKQYRAVEGETIDVDRLPLEIGEPVELNQVLMVADGSKVAVGTPTIKNALVKATVADQFKGPKIIIFRYKPSKRYRKKRGHRQQYTKIKIEEIVAGTKKKSQKEKE